MIIGVTGYKRSGKDTVAELLLNGVTPKLKRIALADVMKQFTSELLGIDMEVVETLKGMEEVKLLSWDNSQATMRTFLQNLGQGIKDITGDELVWCRYLAKQLNFADNDIYVIPDIRFSFEEHFFRKLAELADVPYIMVRVEREGVGGVDTHVSEQSIDSVRADITVYNNGTIEELDAQLSRKLIEFAEEESLL